MNLRDDLSKRFKDFYAGKTHRPCDEDCPAECNGQHNYELPTDYPPIFPRALTAKAIEDALIELEAGGRKLNLFADLGEALKPEETSMPYTFRQFYIPVRMMESLQRYVSEHSPVGDFLTAVLSNDLREAVSRADDENILNLPAYIGWLHNEAPIACWGSPKEVKAWLEAKDD